MIERKEILRMGAGREMDFLVHQKVIIKKSHLKVYNGPPEMSLKNCIEIPYYSTDAYSAEKVLEKTRERYTVILHGATFWECSFFLPTGEVVSSGFSDSLSHAICRAVLLTVIEEERQEKIRDMENNQKLGNVFKWRFKYAKEG